MGNEVRFITKIPEIKGKYIWLLKPGLCTICGKTFKTRDYLRDHVFKVHKKKLRDLITYSAPSGEEPCISWWRIFGVRRIKIAELNVHQWTPRKRASVRQIKVYNHFDRPNSEHNLDHTFCAYMTLHHHGKISKLSTHYN